MGSLNLSFARASKEVDEALRLFSFSLSLLLLFVMKSACVFVVVLLPCAMVGTSEAQVETDSGSPWFYHGIEGPDFQTLQNGNNYDIRGYPKSFWSATTINAEYMDEAGSEAFMRLFRYISGANERNQKIEMTVPVLASVQPGQGPFCKENFTYHFYLPREFQKDPPKPTDPRVTNVEVDALNVAVLSYPGWSNENKVISHGKELFEFLKQDNVTYTSENYFTAGYDSPFRLTDRHNEVWVQVQQIAQFWFPS